MCEPAIFRKRFLFFFLFFTLLFHRTYGQNNVYDSSFSDLNTIISNKTSDIASIKQLIKQAYTIKNVDSALQVFYQTLKLSEAINYKVGIVRSLANIGAAEHSYDKRISYSLLALSYCNRFGIDDTSIHQIHNTLYLNLANDYFYNGQYGLCAYYLYKILEALQQDVSPGNELKGYNASSTKYASRDKAMAFNTYNGLGIVWSKIGDSTRALYYYNVAENIAKTSNDTTLLVTIWNNISSFFFDKGDYKKSKYYSVKALALDKKSKIARLNLAHILIEEGNYKEALLYAINILQDSNTSPRNDTSLTYKSDQIGIYYLLGRAYFKLKDYKRAESYVLPALQNAQQIGLIDNVTNAHLLLTDIYSAEGKYAKALDHEIAYAVYKDSMVGKNEKLINNLEVANQITKKDRELMQKQLTIAQQENNLNIKNLWIAGIATFALLLVITSIFIQKNARHKQNVLKQEQEIGELKAHMNGEEIERGRIARELHDGIVSQLSAVKMNFNAIPNQNPELNKTTDYQEAIEQLEEAIKELRITAHNLMPEILFQGGILEAVHVFCEKISRNGNVFIEFQTYGVIPLLEQNFELSVYRIIQELVYNIIKHARATFGLVQISCKDDLLTVAVEDNGRGMDLSAKSDGVGLLNLKERVNIFKGYLDINSHANTGTAIYLEFDIAKYKKTGFSCI